MRELPDPEIRALCDARQYAPAMQRALAAYGGELMRFLMSRTSDAQLASEAFAVFSEDLCRGLPTFGFRSSVRTWLYALAHHALARTRRTLGRERARRVPFSEAQEKAPLVAAQRSETPAYLKTEVKQRLLALRDRLAEADQTLLALRTTGRFSWKDIARIHLGPSEDSDDAQVDKEAARLRKRYQLVVDRLREMARAEGLLGDAAVG